MVLLATRQYGPRQGKCNGAGAKQRNPGVGRRAGTLVLRAGTECEKNSGQSLIIPGENPRSTGAIAPLTVIMRATISLLRNRFEEDAVTFGYPRERVFRQSARAHCGSKATFEEGPVSPRKAVIRADLDVR